jgi:hypothetical protein
VFDSSCATVISAGYAENECILVGLRIGELRGVFPEAVCIETIESMGLAVGKSTLETMRWVGRLQEAWEQHGSSAILVKRSDEKMTLCGRVTFKNPSTGKLKAVADAQIRQAVIDRFPATGGGKVPQVGTKANPGPLYGVSGHAWSALAIVLTGLEIIQNERK